LSRICEEFNCLPSQALREDIGTILDIVNARVYRRAKAAVEDPDIDDAAMVKLNVSPEMVTLVMENIERSLSDGKRGR